MGDAPDLADPFQTRSSLLRRAASWDEESWEELFRIYRKLVASAARHAGLSEGEADEVVQDVFVQVARKLPEFQVGQEHGSFRSWLLQQTRWRITDKYRERERAQGLGAPLTVDPTGTGTAPIERIPTEPELHGLWADEEGSLILKAAMAALRKQVSARDLQIFDLRIEQGRPAAEVASIHGIKRANVDLIVHRIRTHLEQEITRLRAKMT
ncbi:MAG: sigma-70 family RNA polymerase sigma factor [Verrucomicrobiales bacterium]|nr:sigma-70 family RNA polymerase sigma factor [Verrucomicrobiales bacterium]